MVDKENEAKKETEDNVKMYYRLKKELQDTERKRIEVMQKKLSVCVDVVNFLWFSFSFIIISLFVSMNKQFYKLHKQH